MRHVAVGLVLLSASCAGASPLVDATLPVERGGDAPVEAHVHCERPHEGNNGGSRITCALSHDGAESCGVCWAIELRCANGVVLRTKVCDQVPPGVEVAHVLGDEELPDRARCDRLDSGRVTAAWSVGG